MVRRVLHRQDKPPLNHLSGQRTLDRSFREHRTVSTQFDSW